MRWLWSSIHDMPRACHLPYSSLTEVNTSQSEDFLKHLYAGEELPPLQLNDEVFKSIGQLYDCLLTEVQERGKKGLHLAKKLNSSLGFFCYDLLSVIEPRQVFELVSQSTIKLFSYLF